MKKFSDLVDSQKRSWGGLNYKIFLAMLAIVLIIVYVPFGGEKLGLLRPNFISIFVILAVFGIFFGEIGDRIPIFKEYVGGGTILVFLAAAVVGTYKLVPEELLKHIKVFYNKQPVNFLEIFIPVLIFGSILSVKRNTLIKSIVGYIPLILIGVLGASLGGIIVGLLFGKQPIDILLNYVLPIMGGGTGAGAIPMSEMWAAKTGRPAGDWFAFAISILTIANIIAIILGALLKKLGDIRSDLTGNGQLVIEEKNQEVKSDVEVKGEIVDVAVSLFLTGILAMAGHALAELWSTLNIGFDIHRLAFLVILVILLNVFNLVPPKLKSGAKILQTFFSKHTIWILMAAVGFGTDVQEIIKALTLSNLLISIGIVFGAVLAIMLLARKMKFYPVEAAITAGLCMANRGGSGDIAVLGAADRMELISFAQISSRIGGAMMLILGSVLFGIFA
ncbi:2-hydroxycarboxylate transporter family protein [Oceanivirga salmonicida]|uniref:2-hydroxycarboxylate transporter family protein n=1 Tax=Oceanivirga salmonicida TaxID=1769291 RepID=UPI0008335366|nr:2-hydroxycarboxylate transporter family protein [Oceanivirga salmonicida]